MEASSENLPDEKDAKAIKAYFKNVYPEMDFDRVYASDMKKMVKWFSILTGAGVEIKLREDGEEETETEEAADDTTVGVAGEPVAVEEKESAK